MHVTYSVTIPDCLIFKSKEPSLKASQFVSCVMAEFLITGK